MEDMVPSFLKIPTIHGNRLYYGYKTYYSLGAVCIGIDNFILGSLKMWENGLSTGTTIKALNKKIILTIIMLVIVWEEVVMSIQKEDKIIKLEMSS